MREVEVEPRVLLVLCKHSAFQLSPLPLSFSSARKHALPCPTWHLSSPLLPPLKSLTSCSFPLKLGKELGLLRVFSASYHHHHRAGVSSLTAGPSLAECHLRLLVSRNYPREKNYTKWLRWCKPVSSALGRERQSNRVPSQCGILS